MSIENPWENSANKFQEPQTEHNEIEIGSDGEMIVKRQVGPTSIEEPATVNKAKAETESVDFAKSQNIFNSLGESEKQIIFKEIENNLRGASPKEYQEKYQEELQKIIDKKILEPKNIN